MMDIIFPPGRRGRSRPTSPSGPSTSPINIPWESSESSNTLMAISPTISPVASQEKETSFSEWLSESRDNYEFLLLEDNLEIPLIYFAENGEFPSIDRPSPNVPPLYKDEKSAQEFIQYVTTNEVCVIYIFFIIN